MEEPKIVKVTIVGDDRMYIVGEDNVVSIIKKKYDWIVISFENGTFEMLSPKVPVILRVI